MPLSTSSGGGLEPVDLLIGLDYCHLRPAGGLARDGCAVIGLRLSESKFGCGWIISGSYACLTVSEHKLTNAARMPMNSVAAEPDANTTSHFLTSVREGGGRQQSDCQQVLCAPTSLTLPPEGGEGGDAGDLGVDTQSSLLLLFTLLRSTSRCQSS